MTQGSASPRNPRRELKELVFFAAVLVLATILRVGWPALTEFKFSEARLEALALEITHEGRLPLVGVPSSAGIDHSPLSVYLYAPAFLLTTSPIPATIYGGLLNVLVVALCWRFGKHWPGGSARAGLAGALILAASPWAVLFSRKIWQIAFVPALALAFVACAISGLVLGRRWCLCASIVAYAILAQVHPSAISLAPALLLWLILCWRKELAIPLIAGGVLGVCSAFPFLLHQIQTGWQAVSSVRGLDSALWDFSALRVAWNVATGQGIEALAGASHPLLKTVPGLSRLFGIGGGLLAAAALGLSWRAARTWRAPESSVRRCARVDIILVSWLIAPILFNLRHTLDLQLHFFAILLPATCLITARALDLLLPQAGEAAKRGVRFRRPLNALAWLAIGVLVASQVTGLCVMGAFVARYDTTGGFGRPLSHYLEISDCVARYAHEKRASEVLVVGEGSSPTVDELPAIFDVLFRDRLPYRFVDGRLSAVFPMYRSLVLVAPGAGEATQWYDSWPATELVDGFQLRTGDGSWPKSPLETIPAPRLLQNGVELQGYHWSPAATTSCFWLQWQVLWEGESDTHFYVHLVDAAGTQLGQRDGDGFATASRKVGDHIVTLFDITLADSEPGKAIWARVGMYTYPDLVGVPVIDANGDPIVADVGLGPLHR